MQELAGRLTALDPDASESLKVITFFDSLVAGGAGAESLVRGMMMLSGAAAGAVFRNRVLAIEVDGSRRTDAAPGVWPSSPAGDGSVWIERSGAPHANDAMILERAALAIAIIEARRQPEAGAVEIVLDVASSAGERAAAARRLRLPDGPFLVTATSPAAPPTGMASAVIAVPEGLVRVNIASGDPGGQATPAGFAGVARATDVARLPDAWIDARLALRLAGVRQPIVDADELGALMVLARAFDPDAAVPADVAALRKLDARGLEMLDVLAESESVRAAASILALHHSSLQARLDGWARQLGFDPHSPRGRARYAVARLLQRLSD